MKRSLLPLGVFVISLCFVFPAFGQIPNAGFESWTNGNPDNWFTDNVTGLYVPVTQSHTAHLGTSAVRGDVISLATGGTLPPQIISGSTATGFAISQRYGTMTGYYQFSPVSGDRLSIAAGAYKGGVSGNLIAVASAVLSSAASTYTQFSVPFTYVTNDVPDWGLITVVIAGSSSSVNPHAGSYFLLDDLAFSGTATGVSNDVSLPLSFALEQNYPNPFNPSTNIRFSVAQAGHVTLKMFNLLGTEVASLVNEQKDVGTFSVSWNAAGLPSGMYLYRLSVTSQNGVLFDQTRKLMLLK